MSKKRTAEEEFDAAPNAAEAEFDAADPLMPQEAVAPEVMDARKSRLVEYLKSRPAAIADTARNLVSPDGKVAESFAGGFTLGVVPYLSAAVDAAPVALRKLAGNPGDVTGTFNKSLDRNRAMFDAAEREEPAVAFLGQALSPNLAGKATAGQRMTSAALNSGISDAARGGSGAEGAELGMLAQGAAEGVSPLAKYLGGGLRTLAGRSAANAAGLRGGIVNQAKRGGISTIDDLGEENIPKRGNEMLDEGLIPFMGSKLAVQRRAEAMMEQAANAKNASLTVGDMAGSFPQAQGVKSAAGRLSGRIDPAAGGNLQTARASKPAREFITDAANTPDTFSAADKLKTGAYGSTNYGLEAPVAQKLKRETVSGYRQSIEDELNKLVPGEGDALKRANSRYGLAAQTADFAEEAAGREAANRKLGASDLALGALGFSGGAQAGGLLGGGVAGLALPAAAHFAKTRGASTVAPLARLGSKTAAGVGAVNQAPGAAAAASSLDDYLRPMDDEERQESGAAFLKESGF